MIEYTGKTDIKEKILNMIDEMLQDEDFVYTIQVYENRENEKISKFMVEVINIKDSMPNF
jgi:hypothetical protein